MTNRTRRSAVALALLAGIAATPAVAAPCKAGIIADLHVTMEGWRPIVQTTINGKPAPFILDSGASYSLIPPPVAKAFGLALEAAPFGMHMKGIGGETDLSVATVKQFGLAGTTIPRVQFLVGGSDFGETGLLGQNVLGIGDVEYDLPDGAVRLFKAEGCGKMAMAYWTAGKPFFELPIEPRDTTQKHTVGTVDLDGAKLRAVFDTGAAQTVITLKAAARAGVKPGDPGVERAGWSSGIGKHVTQGWIGRFKLLQVGNEQLHNVRLRIADLGPIDNDMLIGADYFVSHRVYVSNAQHRLYFTYTGGQLFATAVHVDPAGTVAVTGGPDLTAPVDAEGYDRRGAMYQTQHDVPHAIDAFSHAVAMAPKEPRYIRDRAYAYLADRRPVLAMDDLSTTLTLDPADTRARLLRAELRLRSRNPQGAIADLDDVAGRLPREDMQRLQIAEMYSAADAFDPAIAQFTLWLDTHHDDSRRASAQNGRCWARALTNKDLDRARSDCAAAVHATPTNASFLDTRGLLSFRQGNYDAAIADFTAALAINPKLAWSRYCRGLAQRHLGRTAEAETDIAAALATAKGVADRAKRYGLT